MCIIYIYKLEGLSNNRWWAINRTFGKTHLAVGR